MSDVKQERKSEKNMRRRKRVQNRKNERKGINKTVKNVSLLGVGVYAELEEKINALMDRLVEDENITKEEGRKYLNEVKESSREQKEAVSKKIIDSKDATVQRMKELEKKVKDLELKVNKKGKIIEVEDDLGVSGKSASQMRNAENVRRAYAEEEAKKRAEQYGYECECGDEDCEYCNDSEFEDEHEEHVEKKNIKDATFERLKQIEEKIRDIESKVETKGKKAVDKVTEAVKGPEVSGKSGAQRRNAENVKKAYAEAEAKAKKKEKAKKGKTKSKKE